MTAACVDCARISITALSLLQRAEMGKYLTENLGRPSRDHGFWWTDTESGFMLVYFRHREAFVEFSLRYG